MSHLTDDKLTHSGCVQNLMFLALPITELGSAQNLKIRSKIPTTPLHGFLSFMRWKIPRSIRIPNLKCLALPVPNLGGIGPKIQNFGPRLPCTHFAGILSSMRWDMPRSINIPNLNCLALPVTNLGRKSQNLKFWPYTSMTPLCRYFVIRELGHVKIYQCTIFEVSSFTIYTFMAGKNLKIQPLDPTMPLLGVFWHP